MRRCVCVNLVKEVTCRVVKVRPLDVGRLPPSPNFAAIFEEKYYCLASTVNILAFAVTLNTEVPVGAAFVKNSLSCSYSKTVCIRLLKDHWGAI
jgi:hypothetical protein